MIKKKEKISYEVLQKKFKVDKSTIKRDLKELKEKGRIKFVGEKRKGVWRMR